MRVLSAIAMARTMRAKRHVEETALTFSHGEVDDIRVGRDAHATPGSSSR